MLLTNPFQAIRNRLNLPPRRRGSRRKYDSQSPDRMSIVRTQFETLEDRTLLATFMVSNTGDAGPGSLRQAVTEANAMAGVDDIQFLGAGAAGTIMLLSGQLTIADSVNIVGPGASNLRVSGTGLSRVFEISGGGNVDASVSHITIGDGFSPTDGGAILTGPGETLNLRSVTVTTNTALGRGGALFNNGGNVNIDDSTFTRNAAGDGGAIANDVPASATTQFTAEFTELNGSGVAATGTLTLDETDPANPQLTVNIQATGLEPDMVHLQHIHGRFADNVENPFAANGPFFEGVGGIPIDSVAPTVANNDTNGDGFIDFLEGRPAYGPVILNLSSPQTPAPPSGEAPLANFDPAAFPTAPGGNVNFTETYTWNLSDPDQARQYHNLVPLEFREIVLHGLTTTLDIDGDGNPDGYRLTAPVAVAEIERAGGTISISDSTFTDNTADDAVFVSAAGNGGAILNINGSMTIIDSHIADNVSLADMPGEGGGGVFNRGSLILQNTFASNNTATDGLGNGGGLLNAATGNLFVDGGFITGNDAARAGGAVENAGRITLANVVMSDNSAGINGGALHTSGTGRVSLAGGSVVKNHADNEGGGLWNSVGGTLNIDGTTISNNTATVGGGIFNDNGAGTETLQFTLTISELNGSGVTGSGQVTVSQPTAMTREIRVQIDATGLQDLSAFNGIHVAHIHGQFAGNRNRPLLQQGDGPFFDGAGGTANGFPPVQSILPSVAANDGATILDGFLDFLEGRPQYGPVLLNLTSTQMRDALPNGSNPPDGVPPLGHFLALAGAGDIDPAALFPGGTTFPLDVVYTFDLNAADEARQFANLAPLNLREIVIHGQTIDKAISDAIDVAAMGTAPGGVDVGGGMAFRVTAPVAAGEIVAVSGSVTIANATINNNAATGNGGGILNEGGSITITDTSINGNTSGGAAPGAGGGGIFNAGTLYVEGGSITNNTAVVPMGNGGGVLNATGGTLTVVETSITGNRAARAGGGIENAGTTELIHAALSGNHAGINGGGLHTSGSGVVIVDGGSVSNNNADNEGGGLWNSSGGILRVNAASVNGNTAVFGGGIFNDGTGGIITMTGATISNNASTENGGGILNEGGSVTIIDTRITGNSSDGNAPGEGGGGIFSGGTLDVIGGSISDNTAITPLGNGGGILNATGGTLTINGTSIRNNRAARAGGGIENAGTTELTNAGLSSNHAGINGGGLHTSGTATVTVDGGSVSNNTADNEGGGLWNSTSGTLTVSAASVVGNHAAIGGGVFNDGTGGAIIVSNSTIARNTSSGDGGGIATEGGTIDLTNSTISSNQASSSGGGLLIDGATVTVTHVTIADNVARRHGGGADVHSGTFTASNTMIARNSSGLPGRDINGQLNSGGFNLIGETNGATFVGDTASNILNTAPLIGPLLNNGGPIDTHRPFNNSPVVDAGADLGIVRDQIGTVRPLGAAPDIGAVELVTTSLTGRKFNDANQNGVHDTSEAWLNGWTIELVINGDVVASDVTRDIDLNRDGRIDPQTERGVYQFTDVPTGEVLTLREFVQPLWTQTTPEFIASLTPAQEVQTPAVDSTAAGAVAFTFDESNNTLFFRVTFDGLVGQPTAMHIHQGAFGTNGAVIHDLVAAAGATAPFTSPVAGSVVLTAAQATALQAGDLYVNLHTNAFPMGEIRGQIAAGNAYQVVVTTGVNLSQLDFGNAFTAIASLDVDGNGQVEVLSDGILILRFLAGFRGTALVNGVVDPAGTRTDSNEIEAFLDAVRTTLLDVDGDGQALPLSDGITILRFLGGFRGQALVNAVNPAGTRTTSDEVVAFLSAFLPPVPGAIAGAVARSSTVAPVLTFQSMDSETVDRMETTNTMELQSNDASVSEGAGSTANSIAADTGTPISDFARPTAEPSGSSVASSTALPQLIDSVFMDLDLQDSLSL